MGYYMIIYKRFEDFANYGKKTDWTIFREITLFTGILEDRTD